MENVKLVEKVVIVPDKPKQPRRIFLSNIDLSLVVYIESVSFFDPPSNGMSFSEACQSMIRALHPLLVEYDFLAGRLAPSSEDRQRFEIECNGAGFVFCSARTDTKLAELGDLLVPKKEFRQFVAFLQDDENMDLNDKPLASIQFTQLGCGSLVFASRLNHCALDGVAVRDFETNLAALTRGDNLVVRPNADRTVFKARNPPKISFPHFEYSKSTDNTNNLFTVRGMSHTNMKLSPHHNQTRLIHLSQERIASLKKVALKDGKLKGCTTFQVVAAKIWKARSIALNMPDEKTSTILIPVDVRKRVVPQAPPGFAGNALVPAFAHATVKEIREVEESCLVRKVQEGVERLDDEYVRSGIDWLEVNRGVPCGEDSFSLVAWWKLGLEQDEFSWGKVKCATSVLLNSGLVMMLPGPAGSNGGLSICLVLPDDQMQMFRVLMMEE